MATSNKTSLQADIVIIGGGAAGLAAAAAAVEAGVKKVILLEARGAPGGNGVFPLGIFAIGSTLQQQMSVDARVDEVFKATMDYAHWKIDGRIIRALLEKSGDTIRWLEAMGVPFARVVHHFPNQTPEVYHIVNPPKRTGAEVIRALRQCLKNPALRLLTETSAKKLLTDKKGNLTGVLAEAKGKEISIGTRAAVIATGGFAGNAPLVKKYFPSYDEKEILHLMGVRYPGDGLRLALEAGAGTDENIVLEMGAPKYAGPPSVATLISKPYALWVNKKGERFADESIVSFFSEGANAVFQQPEKACYVLFDKKIREAILAAAPEPLEQITGYGKTRGEGLDEAIKAQRGKTVAVADSWKDIAAWIGAPARVLQNTIAEYNSFCERGHDALFAKDRCYLMPLKTPPFYAIKCGVDLLTTHGGIKVDHHMQVLDKKAAPLAGLYAAGVDIGGVDADSYNLNLSGHAFGFSVNSGRIAGENAASYILGK